MHYRPSKAAGNRVLSFREICTIGVKPVRPNVGAAFGIVSRTPNAAPRDGWPPEKPGRGKQLVGHRFPRRALMRHAAGELVFHVFGAIAHFERRLIAERTKDGIAAARAKGKHPGRRPLDADKIAAALSLVKAGLSPTAAAKQLGLGRSTVYREVNRAGIERYPAGARSLETAVGFASGELDA